MAAGGIAVSSGKLKNITEGGAGNAAVSKELQQNPNQNAPFLVIPRSPGVVIGKHSA